MQQKTLVVDDAQLYYEVIPGVPTLVYLHGSGTNLTSFADIREHFSNCGSIAIDLRGDGKSTVGDLRDYTLEQHTKDIREILRTEKVDRAILVGHSLGGMFAMHYAAKHPEEVQGLVLINSTYAPSKTFVRSFKRRAALRSLPFLQTGMHLLKRAINTGDEEHYADFSSNDLGSLDDRRVGFRLWKDHGVQQLRDMQVRGQIARAWSIESHLSGVQAPVLLIQGENDRFVPRQTVFELYDKLPNAQYPIVIPNGQHGTFAEERKHIISALDEFLPKIS